MAQEITGEELSQKYDIATLRKALQKATITNSQTKDILKILQKKDISKKILRETKIGKKIGSLREHKDPQISQLALHLVNKWKKQIKNSKQQLDKKKKTAIKTVSQAKHNDNCQQAQNQQDVQEEDDDNEGQQQLQEQSKKVTKVYAVEQKKEDELKKTGNSKPLWDTYPLADKLQVSKPYLTKAKSLMFNIKNPTNKELRLNLLTKIIKPKELIQMDSKSMASSQMKRVREEKQKAVFQARRMDWGKYDKKKKGMFKCFKCKSQNTQYSEMQTRSGDEPMTTFIQCIDCGNRWKC